MYVDLALILNTGVNFFLLQLTAVIARQRVHFYRLMLVSFGGSLFPLALYLMEKPALLLIPARVLLPCLMVFFAFRPRHWRQGICQYLVFYVCSIALGGLALFLSSGQKLSFSGGEAYLLPPPSLLKLLLAAMLLYMGMRCLEPLLREKLHFYLSPSTLEMEISFGDKVKRLTAFIDTGNMLCCPFSGIPVAVAAYEAVHELLPEGVCTFLESKNSNMDWFHLEAILSASENAAKFCIVPYHSLNEKGFLLAFRPDKLTLREEGKGAVETRLLVAVQKGDRIGADYEVLLPLEAWRKYGCRKKERNTA
ncbi:MAG: sigma-E processing peptidase SpoIIGA [Bacillota bacterium]